MCNFLNLFSRVRVEPAMTSVCVVCEHALAGPVWPVWLWEGGKSCALLHLLLAAAAHGNVSIQERAPVRLHEAQCRCGQLQICAAMPGWQQHHGTGT